MARRSSRPISVLDELRKTFAGCERSSGKMSKQICAELHITPAQWSRIVSLQANFPLWEMKTFIRTCKTDALLRWLAEDCGYTLVRNTKTAQEQAEDKLDKIQDALSFLRQHFKD